MRIMNGTHLILSVQKSVINLMLFIAKPLLSDMMVYLKQICTQIVKMIANAIQVIRIHCR